MSGEIRAQSYQPGEEESVDWERMGRSLRRTASVSRIFAIAVGASLAAQALVGFWRWLRRPPGS